MRTATLEVLAILLSVRLFFLEVRLFFIPSFIPWHPSPEYTGFHTKTMTSNLPIFQSTACLCGAWGGRKFSQELGSAVRWYQARFTPVFLSVLD